MRYIIYFILAILLTSCTTTNTNYYHRTVNSWRGSNIKELLARWGMPSQTVKTLSGNTVYVYKTTTYPNANAQYSPSIGVNVGRRGAPVITTTPNENPNWRPGALPQTCIAAFEFNSKGVIVDVSTQGNHCFGGEDFAMKRSSPYIHLVA